MFRIYVERKPGFQSEAASILGEINGFLGISSVKGLDAGDVTIDAITGATMTSKAVVNGVNAGMDYYLSVLKGGN